MKKLFVIISAVIITALTLNTMAQQPTEKEKLKARQEQTKRTQKELNKKAGKIARKEAKQLRKEGWLVSPGAMPLEKQLDKSYMMQMQYDDEGFPLYIMAEAMSIGGNYDAGKMQAIELAKLNLAGQLQTEITALIESSVANEQLSQSDAESLTRTVMASKNLISQSLGRTLPVVEAYRVVDGNNREVLVRMAYDQNSVKAAAKAAIKKDLEARGDSLHAKLDSLLGW